MAQPAPTTHLELAPPAEARTSLETLRRQLPEHLRLKVRQARELPTQRPRDEVDRWMATSLPAVDELLGGGLLKGQLTELIGGHSSGRYSLALATLAAATRHTYGALVDLGDHFDPQAADQIGIDLERLLWARPQTSQEALASSEMLLQAGFQLVVVNLGLAPVPGGRGANAAWIRLSRAAAAQNAALLILSPYRSSGPAAATVIQAQRMRSGWIGHGRQPRLLARCSSKLRLEKMPGRNAGESTELSWQALELPFPTADQTGSRNGRPAQTTQPARTIQELPTPDANAASEGAPDSDTPDENAPAPQTHPATPFRKRQ